MQYRLHELLFMHFTKNHLILCPRNFEFFLYHLSIINLFTKHQLKKNDIALEIIIQTVF